MDGGKPHNSGEAMKLWIVLAATVSGAGGTLIGWHLGTREPVQLDRLTQAIRSPDGRLTAELREDRSGLLAPTLAEIRVRWPDGHSESVVQFAGASSDFREGSQPQGSEGSGPRIVVVWDGPRRLRVRARGWRVMGYLSETTQTMERPNPPVSVDLDAVSRPTPLPR